MEIMLENDIQTYAGGLGMLAGDILRSLADKEIPSLGVTIAFNNGYKNQIVNKDGSQNFEDSDWVKNDQLIKLSNTVKVKIEGEEMTIGCYRYDIVSPKGFIVPIFLLTTDYFENNDRQKYFTKYLYDPDIQIRLIQEVILGIGGVKMLRELGFQNIENFHMNDGHCAFLPLEVLSEQNYDMQKTKSLCCFTTHTPVPAGRDRFDYEMCYKTFPDYIPLNIRELADQDKLDMPQLAFSLSKYVNGVSRKHGEVSTDMFKAPIDYITNGVHAGTWTSPVTQEIYDRYLPTWRNDIFSLKDIDMVPDDMISEMHRINKKILIDYVNRYMDKKLDSGLKFDYNMLTIGFARRCVAYKRPDLIFHDINRLIRLGMGKIQIIFAGRTHPDDGESAVILKRIIELKNKYSSVISIVYIENYQPSIGKLMYSGCDLWLNNPLIPLEASGTSGMKASMNGTINFSIPDGWIPEGVENEPESAFIIGEMSGKLYPDRNDDQDAENIYKLLETKILPMYYNDIPAWTRKMKSSIRLGAYFNTERVVNQYMEKAWR